MALSRSLVLLAAAAAAACNSVHDDLSSQLLQAPPAWLGEPRDVGLAAEAFEVVLHSDASLTGFWIPSPTAEGRTVVLLHDERTNASVMHPYYTFLHEAGFHVLVVDPRGFGKSRGTPSLRAWIYDLPAVFEWLHERPEVDRQRIAVFGIGLGSTAAMWTVMARHASAAVFEHLPSLRAILQETGDDSQPRSEFAVGMLAFAGLPEDIEPVDNAPRAKVPALFVTTQHELPRDRDALLETFAAYAGDKQLWVVPGAGHAPSALFAQDGEYQRRIADWLRGALGGATEQVRATCQKVANTTDGATWYEVQLTAVPSDHQEPWAVETCVLAADGALSFHRCWVEGGKGSFRVRLPQPPRLVAAARVYEVLGDDEQGFQRKPSALARSVAAVAPLWPRLDALRNGTLPAAERPALATDLAAAETAEPFHPALAAELADVWVLFGTEWSRSSDPEIAARGVALLQRAVASAPKKPNLHVWPGASTTYGYPQATAIDAAKALLQRLGK
jgi:pimeloyl-ACP methyl ester carboxylesterase